MQNNNSCPICKLPSQDSWHDKKREYFRCEKCESIFVNPEDFLSQENQIKRYQLHKNTLEDCGYRQFIETFAKNSLLYTKEMQKEPHTIIDYGSGPEPALMHVLEEFKKTDLLEHSVTIKGWDPYFNNNQTLEKNYADLVLCLEVAEHFENPLEGFAGLSNCCKSGGIVVVNTMLAKNNWDEFKKWWYKEDSTHVSFYSTKGLEICGEKVGLKYQKSIKNMHFYSKS